VALSLFFMFHLLFVVWTCISYTIAFFEVFGSA